MDWLHDIELFVWRESQKPKLVIIYGPTACGKTALSVQIAKYLGTQIISADSRQIYRYMNIGTAKVTEDEKEGIVHHMIDIIEPDTRYSVGEWVWDVRPVLDDLYEEWKIPVVCWGTGLYIDALMYDFSIPSIPADDTFRAEFESFQNVYGNQALWQRLYDLDPEYAAEIHPNTTTYIIRALEVIEFSGMSKRTYRAPKESKYDTFFLCPFDGDRVALYLRINQRVIHMISSGLFDEVRSILHRYGLSGSEDIGEILQSVPGLDSIGYKEVLDFLWGKYSETVCQDLIAQHSRNYAKRQLTWFRNYQKKAS